MKKLIYLFVAFQINLFAQQPVLLLNVAPGTTNGTEDAYTATIGAQYFFYGINTQGRELWRSEGTPAGTHLVKDIYPGLTYGANGLPLVAFKNKVWFNAHSSGNGDELWSSDGTSAGTTEINVDSTGNNSFPDFLAAGTDYLYFSAYDKTNTIALWRTDGTAAGTVEIIKEIAGNPVNLREMVTIGNTAYFTVLGPINGQLWKTNGTAAGTVMVKDLAPGNFGFISQLTAIGNKLYFSGDDNFGNNGEPWVSDGTTNGTVLLQDINPFGSSDPRRFYGFKEKVYFITSDGLLRRTDGTPAGTEQFGNYFTSALSTDPTNLLGDANYLYFGAKQPGTGPGIELWRTDGTVAGTAMVKDLNPGTPASNPHEFAFAGNKLYFQATVDGHGSELAVSDGTEAGTQLFNDIAAGAVSSDPRHIAAVGNHLIFIADHPDYGTELFQLDIVSGTFSPVRSNIELNLYPNPAMEQIVLSLPKGTEWNHARVRLFNMAGNLALETTPTSANFVMFLQGLANGIYLLEYSDNTGHIGHTKLIKK